MKLTAFKYGETQITERNAYLNGDNNIKIPISLLFFLIETDGRRILADVGCDTMPGFEVSSFEKPIELLSEYGITVDEITDILITHAHHDHIDCLHYFEKANVYIHKAELDDAKEYFSKKQNVFAFENSVHICDGITMKHIGGHSEGSSVILLSYGEREYVLCGDECYTKENLQKCIPSGSSYCVEKNVNFIKTYRNPSYITLLFHDAKLIEKTGFRRIF